MHHRIVGQVESPVAIRVLDDFSRLGDQPLSAQLEVNSLDLSLLAPWMPEDLSVEAVVDADTGELLRFVDTNRYGRIHGGAYPGDNHNISDNFGVAVQRTVDFFDKYVKAE